MIAINKNNAKDVVPAWHRDFLTMLPAIRQHAWFAFRNLKPEAREEAVQEVVCNALQAFRRLVELDKTDIAYPSALARYGVAQYRVGRRVGTSFNCRDISSRHCQSRKKLTLQRLDRYDAEEGQWIELIVEDRHCGPDHVAMVRLDFAAWLKTLTRRQRRIATLLATGESTSVVARRFRLTAGRISQLRRELKWAWEAFVDETPMPAVA